MAPVMSEIGIKCHHWNRFVVRSSAVSNAIDAITNFVRHSSCHLSVLSARAPPINDIDIIAMPGIALIRPIKVAESVLSKTIHAWAMFLTWYPANVARFERTSSR